MENSVVATNNTDRKNELKMLQVRKQSLEARTKRRKKMMVLVGILYLLIGVSFFLLNSNKLVPSIDPSARELFPLMSFISILVGTATIIVANSTQDRFATGLIYDLEWEINLLESEDSLPNRSEKLFKQHHQELKRYYDLNLTQNAYLFWVGIFCIFLGFGFIGLTIYLISGDTLDSTQNKLIVAGTGALAGILSNFIGAIYLRMHTNSTNSLTEFHNRFVNTHHFYFSNFLISQIEDVQRREETLASLALSINKDNNPTEQDPK
ncbi:hypothetical protein P9293_21450 [Bacillus inaquosorum]|uniref:TRADD-N-associated membrane domain-containing protein n=1 Tax=Bacillus inaquosorum TaxID=483913 RepID=UPI00031CFC49|nr:hypothetical protein [Bacillus inaquosorum]MDZ5719549.1 hypothetical protein [Bacillus sp. SXabc123]MED4649900.1 hypothetical protein [Bacillus inaquosorum]MED4793333.1 hypothetical protein [Bacillus inaquosorum]